MTTSYPAVVRGKHMRSLSAVWVFIDTTTIFQGELAVAGQAFHAEVYPSLERILTDVGISVLPSFEEFALDRNRTLLNFQAQCIPTDDDPTSYFAFMITAELREEAALVRNGNFCLGTLWEQKSVGFAEPDNLLGTMAEAILTFATVLAEQYVEAHNSNDEQRMKLPNGDRAVVPTTKLEGYCLKPDHPVGGSKARVFRSVLGIDLANADVLRAALLKVARESEEVTPRPVTEYGKGYEIRFLLTGPNGNTARIISGWFIDVGSDIPRLASCYIDL